MLVFQLSHVAGHRIDKQALYLPARRDDDDDDDDDDDIGGSKN